MLASDSALRITEIFCSLQGESSWVGERTVFIRLTGCPLRCTYCDSAYAFHGGELMPLQDIVKRAVAHAADYICVTGGEPLAQPNCELLLKQLCDLGFNVSLETSGAISIAGVDRRVKRVVDLKTPSSGEQQKNLMSNIEQLRNDDEVKFVIGDRTDYEWAKSAVAQYKLHNKVAHVLFSPVFAVLANDAHDTSHSAIASTATIAAMSPRDLADWIIQDQLPVRMQLQQHKFIWGDTPGH